MGEGRNKKNVDLSELSLGYKALFHKGFGKLAGGSVCKLGIILKRRGGSEGTRHGVTSI